MFVPSEMVRLAVMIKRCNISHRFGRTTGHTKINWRAELEEYALKICRNMEMSEYMFILLEKGFIITGSYTGLFISPSATSELDCATTKTYTAERSISIGRESLNVFFVLGALAYLQVPPLVGSRDEKWRAQ